jgi:hypothetical protein
VKLLVWAGCVFVEEKTADIVFVINLFRKEERLLYTACVIIPDFALASPLRGQAKFAQRAACLDKTETCGVNPCGKPQLKANFAFHFFVRNVSSQTVL